jgi:hypothetical protein
MYLVYQFFKVSNTIIFQGESIPAFLLDPSQLSNQPVPLNSKRIPPLPQVRHPPQSILDNLITFNRRLPKRCRHVLMEHRMDMHGPGAVEGHQLCNAA